MYHQSSPDAEKLVSSFDETVIDSLTLWLVNLNPRTWARTSFGLFESDGAPSDRSSALARTSSKRVPPELGGGASGDTVGAQGDNESKARKKA